MSGANWTDGGELKFLGWMWFSYSHFLAHGGRHFSDLGIWCAALLASYDRLAPGLQQIANSHHWISHERMLSPICNCTLGESRLLAEENLSLHTSGIGTCRSRSQARQHGLATKRGLEDHDLGLLEKSAVVYLTPHLTMSKFPGPVGWRGKNRAQWLNFKSRGHECLLVGDLPEVVTP